MRLSGASSLRALLISLLVVIPQMMVCKGGGLIKLKFIDVPGTVAVAQGETVTFRIQSKMSTGYIWQIHSMSDNLELADKPRMEVARSKKGNIMVGRWDYQFFTFRGLREGPGEIILHYKRIWKKGDEPLKVMTIPFIVRSAPASCASAKNVFLQNSM